MHIIEAIAAAHPPGVWAILTLMSVVVVFYKPLQAYEQQPIELVMIDVLAFAASLVLLVYSVRQQLQEGIVLF